MKFPTDLLEKQNPTRNDFLLLSDSEDEGTAKKVQTGEFATSDELTAHLGNMGNPHKVTAAQVGAVASDELTAHISDKGNPHSVTAVQIGAATDEALALHLGDKADPHQTLPEGGQPGQVLLVQPGDLVGWSNNLIDLTQQVAAINGSKVGKNEWKELVPGRAYQRPDGLIEQYIYYDASIEGLNGTVVHFPIAFPNECFSVALTDNGAGCVSYGATLAKENFTVFAYSPMANRYIIPSDDIAFHAVAIGY